MEHRDKLNEPVGRFFAGGDWGADLAASASRLAATGGEIEREIDVPARRCLLVRDPDGLLIRFYVDRNDSLPTPSAVEEETALFLA